MDSTPQAERPMKPPDEAYAETIANYSNLSIEESLYSGHGYEYLSHFLSVNSGDHNSRSQAQDGPNERHKRSSSADETHGAQPACCYLLLSGLPYNRYVQIRAPDELHHLETSIPPQSSSGRIIFLRGYPSAEWLRCIGARYKIDPGFFKKHMSFLETRSKSTNFFNPDLPSSSLNYFQLRLMTIGSRQVSKARQGGKYLEKERIVANEAMNSYGHGLRLGRGWRPGDSIVRRYTLLDDEHFCIEQMATIYFGRTDKSQNDWYVLILLDCGEDLTHSPPGPWLGNQGGPNLRSHLLPGSLHMPRLALNPGLWRDREHEPDRHVGHPRNLHQSLRQLHLRYGRFLKTDTMCSDPFYALSEIFTFHASSQSQVLNVIAQKLSSESLRPSEEEFEQSDPSNILHCQRMLDERTQDLEEALHLIRRRGGPDWPRPESIGDQQVATAALDLLREDFEHLLYRARTLRERCEREMTIILNRATIAEARRGLKQGKSLFRFTVLASLYVPLSFSSTLFGMNVAEFGTGQLSVGVFVAVSLPLFGISVLFLFADWDLLFKKAKGGIRRLRSTLNTP